MKSNYTCILGLIISLFASCNKDETTSNPNNPNNPTQSMEIIVYLNTVTDSTVELKGNILDEGNSPVTVRGFCLTTNNITPDISNSDTFNVGSGVGFYTKTISNLIPGTTYYFRAFGINAQGAAYSDRQSFTSAVALPTVHSVSANAIDQTTATAIGEVINDGGSPVINRGFILYYNSGGMNNNPRTINSGSGNGSFNVTIDNLTMNTTYYLKAFAQNVRGYAYGDEISFTTTASPFTIGQAYQGGKIGYIDNTGLHGLICTTSDVGSSAWGTSGFLNATGTGQYNTNLIVSVYGPTSYAAGICNSLNQGGYTDWFLPSADELMKIYNNRWAIGGFNGPDFIYWSSTDIYAIGNDADAVDFVSGSVVMEPKTASHKVRAVRIF